MRAVLAGCLITALLAPPAAGADNKPKSRTDIRCDNWVRIADGRWSPRPAASISTEDYAETTLLPGGVRVMGPRVSALLDRKCGE